MRRQTVTLFHYKAIAPVVGKALMNNYYEKESERNIVNYLVDNVPCELLIKRKCCH